MKYGAVAAIGVFILLVGLSMPATETITSQSCTEGFSYGDSRIGGGCVEAQTEVPNTTRGPVLLIGFLLTGIGGTMALLSGSLSKAASAENNKASTGNTSINQDSGVWSETADDESNRDTSINQVGGRETKIRITAKTKEPETGRTATSELTVETTDINEAKNQFLIHCDQEGIEVISDLQTEVIE